MSDSAAADAKKQLAKERQRIASKKYYERTKEVEKQRKLEYSQSDHGKAVKQAYYQNNKDRIIEKSKAWYQENKERILSNAKAQRAATRAQMATTEATTTEATIT